MVEFLSSVYEVLESIPALCQMDVMFMSWGTQHPARTAQGGKTYLGSQFPRVQSIVLGGDGVVQQHSSLQQEYLGQDAHLTADQKAKRVQQEPPRGRASRDLQIPPLVTYFRQPDPPPKSPTASQDINIIRNKLSEHQPMGDVSNIQKQGQATPEVDWDLISSLFEDEF